MFTLTQIKSAHNKVKSGADFPAYIQELKKLGITSYETFVADGHTVYYGANDHTAISASKYETLQISETSYKEKFITDLKAHQAAKTDYPTFCSDAAKAGVEKWAVYMEAMTCTYFDGDGEVMLVEQIPQ
ncbi:DUF1398 family protein [Aequorivita sp. SDUM287046]|uniref:DUF1398 family protein n=1 Tax=Aequorivita aurantiaca TaxID=3053356 RepID=A0ABT8DEA5_9FLAO|nr:DUF1398 family protein [Aequorivita aurantiaca]MDN3722889.1 DUF1398 family protein [Aequorivita aurantiaca]